MANPPYNVTMLNSMVSTFLQAIEQSSVSGYKALSFFFGMPKWDSYEPKIPALVLADQHCAGRIEIADREVPWYCHLTNRTFEIPAHFIYVFQNKFVAPTRAYESDIRELTVRVWKGQLEPKIQAWYDEMYPDAQVEKKAQEKKDEKKEVGTYATSVDSRSGSASRKTRGTRSQSPSCRDKRTRSKAEARTEPEVGRPTEKIFPLHWKA